MNNSIFFVLVLSMLLTTGSANGSTQEIDSIDSSVRMKIFLTSRLNIPQKRSLINEPIEAYIEPNLLIVNFNVLNYQNSVDIIIKDDTNVILDYTVYVDTQMVITLPVHLEENSTYILEISSSNGDFMSGIINYYFE